jgi:hypothetical protein
MVQSLYALPDGARRGEEVIHPDTKAPFIVAPPIDLPLAPKEAKLLDLIQREKAEGRRCAIFLEHTGTRDMIPELCDRLKAEGLKALVLRSTTTSTDKREAWILERVKADNPDVLICNPNLVKTGLDLLDFPTIIYFQAGYSIYTLRQSSRRSWRIGQRKPVRVYYLVYANTAQERAMRLIATKLETSNVVEGRLSADGLSAMSEGSNSLIYDIARSIVDGVVEKQSMTDVWKSYTATNQFSSENTVPTIAQGDWEAVKERQVAEQRDLLANVDELWSEKAKSNRDGTFTLSLFDILNELDENIAA